MDLSCVIVYTFEYTIRKQAGPRTTAVSAKAERPGCEQFLPFTLLTAFMV
jgi:hypothetical protein